ncbi:hypothetical protein [Flavobacterium sp.]|uniref:hypothetical protein n=1 Tax=Flavobacterium sp. TaxID=239 RepID=UPI00262C2E2C|nr:hypothetical protein [Flavobacterium sp.]
MKKLVTIGIYFIIALLANTKILAQSNTDQCTISNCSKETSRIIKNRAEIHKKVFYVEGEYNSEIKIELRASHDTSLLVAVYDSNGKIVVEKVIAQKGYHTIQFDTTAFEVYQVIIESTSEVDFVLEKRNFI